VEGEAFAAAAALRWSQTKRTNRSVDVQTSGLRCSSNEGRRDALVRPDKAKPLSSVCG
jgi:hypothetical protein